MLSLLHSLLFVSTLTLRTVSGEGDALKPVYFSFIVSNGEYGYRSSGAIPSIDIALEAVQELQLLPGYNLTYSSVKNSRCTRTDSLNAFFEDTHDTVEQKIAVLGCGCSTATEPVAEISHHWNITQISYASGLSTLSDRTRFKYYFRTLPNTFYFAPAILGVLNNFNWRRIAFITQNQNLFLQIMSNTEELHKSEREREREGEEGGEDGDKDAILFGSAIFNEVDGDPAAAAQRIFDSDDEFHIFMVNSYSKFARHIICEASKRNLVYPHYGWIMYTWYPDRWWTEEVAQEHIDACTDQEMEDFLMKARPLLINVLPEPDSFDLQTDAGFSSNEFTENYEERLWPRSEVNLSTIYLVAFDAMWSMAKMLNVTEELRLRNLSRDHAEFDGCRGLPGELVPLDQFTYSNAFMGCVMSSSYHRVNFTGASGPVRYSEDGTIIYTRIRLAQSREVEGRVEAVRFGYLDSETNFSLVYEGEENDITVYPGEYPPDGTPVTITRTYHTALVVVCYFLAISGILLSILCFLFNFTFRHKKMIRLTTPMLNYVIVLGAMFMYASVFFGVLPTIAKTIVHMQCIVHLWMYGVGYLLVYGTVLAKMWRVYQIFHDPNPNKNVLKTWQLMCVVLIISGVGVLLISAKTVSQIITPPQLVTDAENPQGRTSSAVLEEYRVWQCYQSGSITFTFDLLIFVYLGLLQFVGIILAFQTRKVKIPILNDSKSVTALIYISSIVLVVIVLITFILRGYINVGGAVFSGGIILLATFFLVLIFIPKAMHLYHDPTGDKIFSEMHPTRQTERSQIKEHHNSMIAGSTSELKDAEKVTVLNTQVANLKHSLKVKNKKIAELEAIIKSTT